jgi:dynein heavy chain
MFADSLTDITLELYNTVLEKLPPTPSRFHYVFNLRDLSRVYEGLLLSCIDVIQQPSDFLRLWRNEVGVVAVWMLCSQLSDGPPPDLHTL